jgi:DNA-binding NarL/FixJ family response regulator
MWVVGRSMTPEQALAAQDTSGATLPSSSSSQEPVSTPPAGMTNREFEVLGLVVKGLTNAQIAEQLVIRPVTVNSYLRAIYSKLGVSSRLAAMRYAIDHNLLIQ